MTEETPGDSGHPEKTYEQKVEDLDIILRKLDDSEIPIDELGEKARIGAQLIVELQHQLKSVETEVQDAFKILDESFDKNISDQDDKKM
jgi:exodeoxyribonuclease VII small subunit